MLEPRVEYVYRPSFKKSLMRTMGMFFISGYAIGSSFKYLVNSRCDYGQYLGNRLSIVGACIQLGGKGICTFLKKVPSRSASG